MTLADFMVVEQQPEIESHVVIAANDDKQRVLAFVDRGGLDDYGGKYLGRPRLTAHQRVFLLRSDNNLGAVSKIIATKYAQGEISLFHRYGSTFPRVDIGFADLETGPRLEVAPLIVLDAAGFKGGSLWTL